MRLASAWMAHAHPFPTDNGQHWAIYVCEYSLALFGLRGEQLDEAALYSALTDEK